MRDKRTRLKDPVPHRHLRKCHAPSLAKDSFSGENLAEKGNEDGDERQFDRLRDEGRNECRGSGDEVTSGGNAVAPAWLNDGGDEPDAAQDGGVDAKDEDGDG
jgi:hypothetical protein